MRDFLVHIVFIVVLVLLFNFGYVWMIGGNLRDYARKYLDFPDRINVLVLGDSHALLSWRDNHDEMIYNFSNGSDDIIDMKYKFDYATAHNQLRKGTVILSFEPHLISSYREIKQNNRINSVLNKSYLNMRLVYALPLIFDPDTEFDFKRFILSFKSDKGVDSSRVFNKKAARARFQQQFPNAIISKKLLNQYQGLINSIRKQDYEIIGIKYPVHPYYDSMVRNDPRSKYLETVIDSLAKVNNLEVLNFSDIITYSDLFRDQDHLNVKGSTIFIDEFRRRFLDK